MIQFAAAAAIAPAIKELGSLLVHTIEDPNNYKRLEGLRVFLSRVTGKEIDQNAFVALLELTTQGEPYTGKWERIGPKPPDDGREDGRGRRLRVDGGYIYDIGRGNPVFVPDR